MAGSFKKIDYRLRPAKHAERIMLIDLFKRMRFAPIETYQYIGFGSVAFIDFRMVHKALGIKDLISIEDTDDRHEKDRFRHNNPYEGLLLHFGNSNEVLPKINLKKQSLVWLDYDGSLSKSMANDLAIVGRNVPSGSFVAVTFPAFIQPTGPSRETELNRLKEEFPDFLKEHDKATELDGPKYARFGRSVLGALLEKAVSDADAGHQDPEQIRSVKQICFFKYRDGIPMATIGWLIISKSDAETFDMCNFDDLNYVRTGNEPFQIKIPLITPLEVREMERRLPNLDTANDLNWIPKEERSNFLNVYRYLPHFASVEQI